MADKEKCEHCEQEVRDHSHLWLTTKPDYPNRPVEDGPEWGIHRLWIYTKGKDELSGIICNACWAAGKRFKKG